MRSHLISRKGAPVTQGIPEGLKSSVSGVVDEDQILEQKIPITPVTQEIMSFGGSMSGSKDKLKYILCHTCQFFIWK